MLNVVRTKPYICQNGKFAVEGKNALNVQQKCKSIIVNVKLTVKCLHNVHNVFSNDVKMIFVKSFSKNNAQIALLCFVAVSR